MTDEAPLPESGFSADYVKQLREENANWRRKVRDLETKTQTADIAIEFARRGIQADPTWIRVPEGMSATEAVDMFVSSFPVANSEPEFRQQPPQPLTPGPVNANVPGPPAQGAYGGRSLEEIKKDPKARQALREQYRNMLRGDQPESYL